VAVGWAYGACEWFGGVLEAGGAAEEGEEDKDGLEYLRLQYCSI
jgi:hypothetical protein